MADRPKQHLIIQDPDKRIIAGFASVEIKDLQNDIIPVNVMERAMYDFMERGGIIMYGHTNNPVGKVLRWEIRKHPDTDKPGLWIEAELYKNSIVADQIWEGIKEGKVLGFSIGGVGKEEKTKIKSEDGKEEEADLITYLELMEISIVEEPANPYARIEYVNYMAKGNDDYAKCLSIAGKNMEDFCKWVAGTYRSYGFENIEEAIDGLMAMITVKEQGTVTTDSPGMHNPVYGDRPVSQVNMESNVSGSGERRRRRTRKVEKQDPGEEPLPESIPTDEEEEPTEVKPPVEGGKPDEDEGEMKPRKPRSILARPEGDDKTEPDEEEKPTEEAVDQQEDKPVATPSEQTMERQPPVEQQQVGQEPLEEEKEIIELIGRLAGELRELLNTVRQVSEDQEEEDFDMMFSKVVENISTYSLHVINNLLDDIEYVVQNSEDELTPDLIALLSELANVIASLFSERENVTSEEDRKIIDQSIKDSFGLLVELVEDDETGEIDRAKMVEDAIDALLNLYEDKKILDVIQRRIVSLSDALRSYHELVGAGIPE